MNLNSYVIIVFLFIVNIAEAQNQSCISQNKEIEALFSSFQDNVRKLFNKDSDLIASDYKLYLDSFLKETIPREFYTNVKIIEQAKALKKSETFHLIWDKLSKVESKIGRTNEIRVEPPRTAKDDKRPPRPDPYIIDTFSAYFNCLIENSGNKEVNLLLKEIRKAGSVSPFVIASSLIRLNDFEDESVQRVICLYFYYDIIYLMNGMSSL